jgi:hypothetical protein
VVKIGKQLAEALRMLHTEARIAHFDVKPENILLDSNFTIHLCDFSIALEFPPDMPNMRLPQDAYGSLHYMAPEQLTNLFNGLTFRADVWGVASTLLHLHTGRMPFEELVKIQRIHDALRSGQSPAVPPYVDERFATILRMSFKHNPATRIDVVTLRHALSQFNEELRIEAGGEPTAPADVVALTGTRYSHTATSTPAPAPNSSSPRPPAAPADGMRGAPVVEVLTPPGAAPLAPLARITPLEAEADFLGIAAVYEKVSLVDSVPVLSSPATPPAGRRGEPSPTLPHPAVEAPLPVNVLPALPPRSGGSGSDSDGVAVVVTACSNGRLGIKCLFRSFAKLISHPTETKQMTGVAIVQRADGSAAREAVSVSTSGTLTQWDMSDGRCLGSCPLAGNKLPAGSVGRSVSSHSRFTIIGTDRSRVSLWRFPGGGASWLDANAAVAATDEVCAPSALASLAPQHQCSSCSAPAYTHGQTFKGARFSLQRKFTCLLICVEDMPTCTTCTFCWSMCERTNDNHASELWCI